MSECDHVWVVLWIPGINCEETEFPMALFGAGRTPEGAYSALMKEWGSLKEKNRDRQPRPLEQWMTWGHTESGEVASMTDLRIEEYSVVGGYWFVREELDHEQQ